MVATETIRRELVGHGFEQLATVDARRRHRAVSAGLHPCRRSASARYFFACRRIAAEKSLPAFLDLDLPGSKLVVGDGHLMAEMKRRYPTVHFAGCQEGEALVRHYASADVFVLPSRTETFGLVRARGAGRAGFRSRHCRSPDRWTSSATAASVRSIGTCAQPRWRRWRFLARSAALMRSASAGVTSIEQFLNNAVTVHGRRFDEASRFSMKTQVAM